ncbi:GNAT family N-acetyltransferase [Altererythrobacter sp. GH1-8]|uniref:GNAT family N-acetyltransferase n=1 Tax=Altererythrobacter sp. GH1-8 TaxID=3349333 RepID=UPI00374DF809
MQRAIRSIGPYAYSAEQIAAWSARHPGPERFRERHVSGDTIRVAVDPQDRPVAYALLEADGHLDHLYCDPDHTRRGLAHALLAEMEQRALQLGCERLYTEASELAVPSFERAGYAVTHRRDFTIAHDGREVAIHNYAMEKALG